MWKFEVLAMRVAQTITYQGHEEALKTMHDQLASQGFPEDQFFLVWHAGVMIYEFFTGEAE